MHGTHDGQSRGRVTHVTLALRPCGRGVTLPCMRTARARSRVLALASIAAAALACGSDGARDRGRTGGRDGAATAAVPPRAAVPVLVRADSLVHAVVRLIARGDADSLARLATHPELPPDTAAARASIAAFARHFDGAAVARIERVRTMMDDTTALRPDHAELVYRLTAANGRDKLLGVNYDGRRDRLHPYDELLGYAWQAQGYATAITAALRDGDAMRLARHLSVDDIDYPPALARQVIATYRARVDLRTLTLRAEGLAPERELPAGVLDLSRPFRFTLLGTKDGRPVAHPVQVLHGDGLVGWVDPWVPEAPAR